MSNTVIEIENISKKYQLGTIGSGSLCRDVQSWWAKFRGKEDPNSLIGESTKDLEESFWALRDVSFKVAQGDVVGIIGRNGAGKSTLLKILSRVTGPTQGQIKIKGRIASLLEVGTGFHPELTGRENIYLNGTILGMRKAEIDRNFEEIVSFAEVEKFIDTPVKRYSSGMYVRLAFAVAAHLDPEILIVDEVLAVGDLAFQKKCLGKMGEMGKSGKTVLFVSHNLEAINTLCSKGILLHKGKLLDKGGASAIVKKYLANSRENISLDNCNQRGGAGGVKFESVSLKKQYVYDEKIIIELQLAADPRYYGKEITVAIGVDTEEGTRLFTCLSRMDDKLHIRGEKLKVRCELSEMPLVAGRYLISVAALFKEETLDVAEHCEYFEITNSSNSDLYDKKYSGHGNLRVPFRFSCCK